MKVLGLSAYFHDSSAALVIDGGLIAAAAEERFTRQKHDRNFPQFAIRFCLQRAGLKPVDLDRVVFYERPELKFTRVLSSIIAGFPSSGSAFVSGVRDWLGNKLWIQAEISRELDIDARRVCFQDHHASHQAQAFLCSPFGDSAILTVDAVGEWACTGLAYGQRDKPEKIVSLETIMYPHSLGLAYAAFTSFLGFRPNDAEASTMALAAFGQPKFVDEVRTVIRTNLDGTYTINDGYLNLLSSGLKLFTKQFIARFGLPRDYRKPLPFDCLNSSQALSVTPDDQRYADIAASVQVVIEDTLVLLAKRARRLTGSQRLCMAGGVALNAVANTRVILESGFEEVFIPPDPGDGGAAIGAALLECARASSLPARFSITPWVGESYESDFIERMAAHLDPGDWTKYRIDAVEKIAPETLDVRRLSYDELVASAVEDLLAGDIVGWFQGPFELGPRALGNRSILADPANLATVRRLSARVKQRATFRPYALAVREEDVEDLFDFPAGIPRCARWMQMVSPVIESQRDLVRGAIHYDGTTRLQVCSCDHNPRFHALLSGFAGQRGLGALLNTSFNDSGYPLVASPVDALLMFARTDMDVLVVENLVVRRVRKGVHSVDAASIHNLDLASGVGGRVNV